MKKHNRLSQSIICLATAVAMMTSSAFAAEPDLLFSSLRQQAMGGISTATSESASALYQNPASLATLGGIHLKFPRIRASIGTEGIEKFQEISELQSKQGSNGDTSDQIEALKALVPMSQIFSFGLYPLVSYSMPGLAIGAYADSLFDATLTKPANPVFKLSGRFDGAVMVGFADTFDVLNGPLNVGVTAKYVTRGQIYNKNTGETVFSLGSGDLIANLNGTKSDTPNFFLMNGIGVDLGVLRPLDSQTQIGFVLKNLGSTLSGDMTLIDADTSAETVSSVTAELPVIGKIGLGFTRDLSDMIPVVGPFIGEITAGIDYSIISPETSLFKNLNMGVEKDIWVFTMRGGLNQGYVVGGFGVNLLLFHLDYVYNTYEAGSEIGVDGKSFHTLEIGIGF